MKNKIILGSMIVGLGLAGCNQHSAQVAPAKVQTMVQTVDGMPRTALGAYLAARIAEQSGDTKAAADLLSIALSFDTENADLLQSSMVYLLNEGRFSEAVPVAKEIVTYESDAPWALITLGVDALENHDFSTARKNFAAIPRRAINTVLAPLLVAWSLEGNGLTDDALDALSALSQFEGFKGVQALHAGLILDHAGRLDAALEQYKIALNGPMNIRTVEAVGSLYQRLGRMDDAKELYDRYGAEHPDSMLFSGQALLAQGKDVPRVIPDAQSGIASVFFDVAQLLRQGDTTQLAVIYNRLALQLQPNFPLAQLTAGDLFTAKGDIALANGFYRGISDKSPVHSYAHLKIATNLDDSGDTNGAIQELKTLQEQFPKTIEIPITLGDIERRHRLYADAAIAYGQAIALYHGVPEDVWSLYFSRGVAYERSHDWPKAQADFEQALSLKPEQPDVMNYLGYSLVDRGEDLEHAKAMIQKAVKLRPNDGAILDSLGWALYRMGDFFAAVTNLERAVELKPEDATINEHLGDAYWKAGRLDEARMQWKRALSMEPDPDEIDGLKERNKTGRLHEAIPVYK